MVPSAGDWTFQLRSYFFDAYLVAFDSEGTLLGEDDDGLLGTHAKLVLSLERGMRIRLEACALHGGRGSAELQMDRGRVEDLEGPSRREAEIADGRQRVKAVEAFRGPEHPSVALALNNLVELLYTQSSYAEAQSLCERALAIFEKDLGPEHPGVGVSLNNIAHTMFGEEKLLPDGTEAVRLWRSGGQENRAKVIQYCAHDVALTKRIHEFGITHGYVRIPVPDLRNSQNVMAVEVPVPWANEPDTPSN